MPVAGGPFIQKTGILLEVDAADKTSYSGTGTTWINQITPGTFNGTLNNVSFNSSDANGALVFTGSNTFVDFGNLGSSLTSSFSFQVAFKPAATASGQPYTILSYASASATSSFTFKLDYTASNQTVVLTTFAGTGSQNTVYALSASVTPNTWNIIDGTYGSQILALFSGGNLVASVPTTGSTVGYNTNNRLYLGGTYGVNSGIFTGSVAKVTVNNADLDVRAVATNYNAFFSRFGLGKIPGLVTDFDAAAFVEVAALTSEAQLTAINNLVIGLKANNLWTKMQAIYPFVGGTAYAHKFNLKDPRTLTSSFPATFYGDLTHTSFGIGSGSLTGYADSNFLDIRDFADISSSLHVSYYGTTTNRVIGASLPVYNDRTSDYGSRGIHIQSDSSIGNIAQAYGGNMSLPSGTTLGLSVVTRTTSLLSAFYHRKPSQTVNVSNSSTFLRLYADYNVRFLGGWYGWGGKTIGLGFASIGTGLSQTDAENLYTVVQAYQTTLGRQVS
jgi:hypothetical protein